MQPKDVPGESLQFVLLQHDHPTLHWDLMFEHEQTLKTWRLLELPIGVARGTVIAAVSLANHRLAYLDYEGPVSGGRGSVLRVDRGGYSCVRRETEEWEIVFQGALLQGRAILQKVNQTVNHEEQWAFRLLPEHREKRAGSVSDGSGTTPEALFC